MFHESSEDLPKQAATASPSVAEQGYPARKHITSLPFYGREMARSLVAYCRSIDIPLTWQAGKASTDMRTGTAAWDRSRDSAASSASCLQGTTRGSGKPIRTMKGGLVVRTRMGYSCRMPERVSRVVRTRRVKGSGATDRPQYTCYLEEHHAGIVKCCRD